MNSVTPLPARNTLPRILTLEDLGKLPPPRWHVKGLFERGGIVELFGPSGGGKTFAALDLALCIATGTEWHGERVSQGSVLYICGEGLSGLFARIEAWLLHYCLQDHDSPPLLMTNQPVPLRDPELSEWLIDMVRSGGYELVVIDTLQANFGGGEENRSQDMGEFVDALRRLHVATGCTSLTVHHTGHENQGRSRGHSALKGALDTEIRVAKHENDDRLVEMKVVKQRNAETWLKPRNFRFQVHDLDMETEDGDPITSCVLVPDEDGPDERDKPLGPNQRIVLEVVRELLPGGMPLENDCVLIKESDFMDALKARIPDRKERSRQKRNYIRKRFRSSLGGFVVDPAEL